MPPSVYPSNLGNPFTLGVASGDPAPEGFVLWTRLAPDPLNGGEWTVKEGVAAKVAGALLFVGALISLFVLSFE